jgi:hypothetical protein
LRDRERFARPRHDRFGGGRAVGAVRRSDPRRAPIRVSRPIRRDRADAERRAGDSRPYVSDAEPRPILLWSRFWFWGATLAAIAIGLVAGAIAEQRQPHPI